MIATLSGVIAHKQPDSIVIDVGGVGYEVFISSRTHDLLPPPGERGFLHIHTNVREDAIILFGFTTSEEKKLFLLLNTVSGVGPKLALNILSGIAGTELCQAISCKNLARLTSLSGVGKKTAERLCMELGDKVGQIRSAGPAALSTDRATDEADPAAIRDAASALMNLGYPQNTAFQVLEQVQQSQADKNGNLTIEELIREALKALADNMKR